MQGIKSLNIFKQIENHTGKHGHHPGMNLPEAGKDIHTHSDHEKAYSKDKTNESGHGHERKMQLAEFRDQIMQARDSGEINIEELANQAPESAIEFAARHNIEMKTLIERIAEGHPRLEIREFRQTILESKEQGTLDSEAVAKTAPQILRDYAEEHSISLIEMIEQIAEEKSDQVKHIPGMGPGMFIQAGKGAERSEYANAERRMDNFLMQILSGGE